MFEFITRHLLMAAVTGGAMGVTFMVILIEFDHYTSTAEFCTVCHSMALVAEPYYQSSHYNPASGVRADCGDCHVSEGVFAATWDHLIGAKDLYKQLFGSDYDDPVVNKLHLPDAAFAARNWFAKRNSATCHRCHTPEAIVGTRPATALIHQQETEGKSCIGCHYNLVHTPVPHEKLFNRDEWNRQVEQEFGLEPGSSAKILEQGQRL